MITKLICVLVCAFCFELLSSDHADPLNPPHIDKDEGKIAGLFAFTDRAKTKVSLILTFFPKVNDKNKTALDAKVKPVYDFKGIDLGLYLDLNAKINQDNSAFNQFYGGTVEDEESIKAEASLKVSLNNDGSLNSQIIQGFKNKEKIKLQVGLFDDPFIYPAFFGKNIMAMVVDIPMICFPKGQDSLLIWGESNIGEVDHKHKIDHGGRAIRTMLARFDGLNALPPELHVSWLRKQMLRNSELPDAMKLKKTDISPDVVILDITKTSEFPNGRSLTDDIVLKVHLMGDSGLYVKSMDENGNRVTRNDQPFLTEFPYLAAPNKVK